MLAARATGASEDVRTRMLNIEPNSLGNALAFVNSVTCWPVSLQAVRSSPSDSLCLHSVQSTASINKSTHMRWRTNFFTSIASLIVFSLATFRLIWFTIYCYRFWVIIRHVNLCNYILFSLYFYPFVFFHILPLVVRLCCHSEEFQVHQRRFYYPTHFRVIPLVQKSCSNESIHIGLQLSWRQHEISWSYRACQFCYHLLLDE